MAERRARPPLKITSNLEDLAQLLVRTWVEDVEAGRPPLSSLFPRTTGTTTPAALPAEAGAPGMRLSRAELRELTGSPRKDAQLTWCRENGIPAIEDVRGFPVVLRAALEARLLPQAARAQHKRTEPDLSALVRNKSKKP